jgi:hypothetical protein
MPSSVRDRPTVDHEYIFMFSKTNYYYNADAIREPHVTFSDRSKMRGGRNYFGKKMEHLSLVRIQGILIYMMVDGIRHFNPTEEINELFGKFH